MSHTNIHKFILSLTSILIALSCEKIGNSTCDCFDEPDYAFGCRIDIKKLDTTITIKEFLSTIDSNGYPKEYSIRVYTNDSTFDT